jgi:hypothetical protein
MSNLRWLILLVVVIVVARVSWASNPFLPYQQDFCLYDAKITYPQECYVVCDTAEWNPSVPQELNLNIRADDPQDTIQEDFCCAYGLECNIPLRPVQNLTLQGKIPIALQ